MKHMKAIIFATSLSGKTITLRQLQKVVHVQVSEIDEELKKIHGGVFPTDLTYKHQVLAPQIIAKVLQQKEILFFCNTDYFLDEDIVKAKDSGFAIIQLIVPLEELKKRNAYRMEHEGYDDMSQWLEGMITYQQHIFEKRFVDKTIDGMQPTHAIVKLLLTYLSE